MVIEALLFLVVSAFFALRFIFSHAENNQASATFCGLIAYLAFILFVYFASPSAGDVEKAARAACTSVDAQAVLVGGRWQCVK